MKRLLMIICLATALIASASSPAHAQQNEGAATTAAVLTSAGVIGGALLVGGVTTTIVVVLADPARKAALQRYLRTNEPAVRSALAMGGGDAVHDLADILDVPKERYALFGARLRKHRSELLRVAYEKSDAEAFVRIATGESVATTKMATGG